MKALVLVATLLAQVRADAGNVLFVDDDAVPGGNGVSWETAYQDLQDALAFAAVPGNGVGEIRVAQGIYKPTGILGDRTISFDLIGGVLLLGGYAGIGGVDPDARDVDLFETILSGDLNGDDGPEPFEDNDENSYHVVTATIEGAIDGFTLTAGNANGEVQGSDRGGGLFNEGKDPLVSECRIINNSAKQVGGGVYSSNLFGGWISVPRFTDCLFMGNSVTDLNSAFNNNGGGAIFNGGDVASSHTTQFINCVFTKNIAPIGGAMLNKSAELLVTNCVFDGNLAEGDGGAIYSQSGVMTVTNSSFSQNVAGRDGGGNFLLAATTSFTNCILWGNSDKAGNGESAQIWHCCGSVVVNVSCIQGGWSGEGGFLVISKNPMFEDSENGNLHLNSGSPCIDAGFNDVDTDQNKDGLQPLSDLDLDGNPRFVDDPGTKDTGIGDPPIVDMGAYEFQLLFCPWDFDNTGDVGVKDLLFLLGAWGPNKGHPADFDNSGTIDVKDLLILLGNWGPCP